MVSLGRQQEPGGTDNQTSLTVEWPLDLFRKAGRVSMAEREVERAQFHVADRERLLAAEVRAAYGAAVAAARDLEVFDEIAVAAARQYEIVRGRVDEGATPPIERDLLAVERRRIDADRLMNAARADAALLALKRLLGLAPSDTLTLRDTLESLVNVSDAPAPSVEQAALRQRPDVREAEATVHMAEASIDRARREGRLDLSLFGTYTRMRTTFPQLGFTSIGALQPVGDTFHYLTAGATLTIPLRNNNGGEIAATEARRAGAEARREAAELQARTEVAAASTLDQQARAAVAMYAQGVRPLARQNVEIIRQTYELGRGTIADVLTEQRRYLEIERAYTDALKQAYDARTSLLSALGVKP
jgi:cobalt-zinc-cadmium efflux system outer membrane protein